MIVAHKDKIKYRIKFVDEFRYPYQVQMKNIFFWADLDRFDTIDNAEKYLENYIINPPRKYGSVVKEITDSDLVAIKLKGKVV